jgi:hypothetical protein
MFVPDLLHEFELGVWKAIFTHLIRLLYAVGEDTVQQLNRRLRIMYPLCILPDITHRYRQVPTFGRDTIRRFSTNASAMKKLAGRDFEDLLQCGIPVFEGLLPAPHDELLADLLFTLASWHACAKLRLHTEMTLIHLDNSTTLLGQLLRKFVDITCAAFVTRELPKEVAARTRRRAAASAKKASKPINEIPAKNKASATQSKTGARKLFNLCTYKLHALGDYVKTIRLFGTSDSYSTQVVSPVIFLQGEIVYIFDRASWSIVVSRDSLHVQIKAITRAKLPDTSVVKGGYTT